MLDGCAALGTEECDKQGSFSKQGLATSTLRFGIRCSSSDGACVNGADLHSALAILNSATVTISDPEAPDLTSFDGTVKSGGWLRGPQTASVTGTDETGIAVGRLVLDGVPQTSLTTARDCDYTLAAPCVRPTESATTSWTVDTKDWSDGMHQLMAQVQDAGKNWTTSQPVQVKVDNTAPAAPRPVVSDTGATWSAARQRTLTWTLPPGQVSPVVGATVRVCKDGIGPCSPEVGADSTTRTTVTLPSAGTYVAQVRLTDEAGNTSAANVAETTLRLDDEPPAAPTLGTPQQESGATFAVPLTFTTDASQSPVVASDGELCQGDGTACTPLGPQQQMSTLRATVPSKGTWLLRAWVRDAAGNRSAAATASIVYADPPPEPGPSPTVVATTVATAAPSPAATPEPEPKPDPPATPQTRLKPAIKLTTLALDKRRLRLASRFPADARGRVTIRLTTTIRGHRSTFVRRRTLGRRGRLDLVVRVGPATRGTVTIAYAGDAHYLPRTLRRTVKR